MNNEDEKLSKNEIKINDVIQNIDDEILSNLYNTTNQNDRRLDSLKYKMNKTIDSVTKRMSDYNGTDLFTFLNNSINDQRISYHRDVKNIQELFSNEESLFNFFNNNIKNDNFLYEDLDTICKHLQELQEAVYATRDQVVTADDVSKIVSRNLSFGDWEVDDLNNSYIKKVEEMEKENKLLNKIKNHLVPKTLIFGNYYAYTIPYKELFKQYYMAKLNDVRNFSNDHELKGGMIESSYRQNFKKINPINESYVENIITQYGIDKKDTKKEIMQSLNNISENIFISDEFNFNAFCLMEGLNSPDDLNSSVFATMSNNPKIKEITKNVFDELDKKHDENTKVKFKELYMDKTVDQDILSDPSVKKFDQIIGCYTKLIDPRNIIPIKIHESIIGYYYVHSKPYESNDCKMNSPYTLNNRFNLLTVNNPMEMESNLLSTIVNNIVDKFDYKFLKNNEKFKDIILSSLIYNDIYKNQISFQFIPIDYITHFKINEDEEGNGHSMLEPALFYAKLYFALLLFKMISILTKSNDTRIYYVRNSGINTDITNKVNEIARNLKERQLSLNDLMSYKSIVSKIGQNREIFMPVGPSGSDKGLEFDILSGQDIQLNTDLMEFLKNAMINATGVPSVIMEYVNQADYARSIGMGQIKFLGRALNYSLDFDGPITELYQKIMKFSNIEIPEELQDEFVFSFHKPKSLNTNNIVELMGTVQNEIEFISKTIFGESPDEEKAQIKEKFNTLLTRDKLPMLEWDRVDELLQAATLETIKEKIRKSGGNEEGSEDGGSSDGSYSF